MSLRRIIELVEEIEARHQNQSVAYRESLFTTKCSIRRVQERLSETSPPWIHAELEKILDSIVLLCRLVVLLKA